MNERSEPFREEAYGVAVRVLPPEHVADPEVDELFVRDGLYIADVLEEARQFRIDWQILKNQGLSFPAIRFGENLDVPLALSSYSLYTGLPVSPAHIQTAPFYADYVHNFVRDWERRAADRRRLLPLDKAMDNVRTGLIDFLMTRIASVAEFFGSGAQKPPSAVALTLPKTWLSTTRVKTAGFGVTVHSSPNLRIHVSRAFRVNWQYFGAPSSPTQNTLPGGNYLFAADGGPYPTITPDTGTFNIPYGTVSPVLNL